METRASYVVVGTFVLILLSGLVVFALWLSRTDFERIYAEYDVMFEDSVAGLQQGAGVQYRGIPVGKVLDIRIDPENAEQIIATVEIREGTPIHEDTVASLSMQGLTGLARIELRGGAPGSPPLAAGEDETRPRIPSVPSAIEQVFASAPDLLANAINVTTRLGLLLSDTNLAALGQTVSNVETITSGIAGSTADLAETLELAREVAKETKAASGEFRALAADVRLLTAQLDDQVAEIGPGAVEAIDQIGSAAERMAGVGTRIDVMLRDMREPWVDFSQVGLYEFSQMVGELRQLVASLSRITKEFERDPAGFLIGGAQKGFEAP